MDELACAFCHCAQYCSSCKFEQVRGRPQRLERLLVVELVIFSHTHSHSLAYLFFVSPFSRGTMTHTVYGYGRGTVALFMARPVATQPHTQNEQETVSNLHHRAFLVLLALRILQLKNISSTCSTYRTFYFPLLLSRLRKPLSVKA